MAEIHVETFEEIELTSNGEIESSPESMELIEKLGLNGQKNLASPEKPNSLCPYREITTQESNIYRTLCPQSTKVEDYDDAPIPLRVLQVVAHAKSLGYFSEILVWHPATQYVSDPVLIGVWKEKDRTWNTKTYILARWGAELKPIAELAKEAMARAKNQVKNRLAEAQEKLKRDELSIDTQVERFIAGERGDMGVSYYGFTS